MFWFSYPKVSIQVLRLLALSIKYDLLQETAAVCHKAPFRDPASKLNPKVLFPLLHRFFSSARELHVNDEKSSGRKEWLNPIVLWLLAEAHPTLFANANGRRRLARNFIQTNVATSLGISGFDTIMKSQLPQIRKTIKNVGKLKGSSSSDPPVVTAILSEISEVLGTSNAAPVFHDIGRWLHKSHPTFFWSEGERATLLREYHALTHRIAADEARSAHMVACMVVGNAEADGGDEVVTADADVVAGQPLACAELEADLLKEALDRVGVLI